MDVRSCVDDVAHLLAIQAHAKGLEVIASVDPLLPERVIGDPGRLRQVLLNLGSNAIKFTRAGEVAISVSVASSDDTGTLIRCEVRDTGIGIPSTRVDALFQPFSQIDASTTRHYGGTGLGLSIVRRLAELMDGEVGVDSEPHRGSCFHFTLPFGLQRGPQPAPEVGELRGMRLLIVDDHPAARELLSVLVSSLGLHAEVAVDGEAALVAVAAADAADRPFKLVLLDWRMPGMDGVECLARLTGIAGRHAPPTVLMVTAFSRDLAERQLQARGLQVAALLPKPVTPSALLDACVTALGLQAAGPRRSEQKLERLQARQASLAGARILLVEDNAINQELACGLLERAGIVVTIAADGREALAALDSASFDAVLMDCQMPVMDGYEATRALRLRPALKDLPVIAMTANAMAGDREKVLAAGMNDHVAKPFRVDELFATLASWVRPASAQPVGEALPMASGLDVRAGLAAVDGNEALYRRLLGMFRQREADFEARVRAACARGDTAAALRCAHDLKSVAGTLGMQALQQAAAALEAACGHDADEAVIAPLLADVTRVLEPLLRALPEPALA